MKMKMRTCDHLFCSSRMLMHTDSVLSLRTERKAKKLATYSVCDVINNCVKSPEKRVKIPVYGVL